MARIVSIHSYRGGTGKSNISASVASLVARAGYRVAVVDTDIQSPGIHLLFGLAEPPEGTTLNDFLWGRCEIGQAAHRLDSGDSGALYVVPSSIKTNEIARILREGYDVGRLNEGFRNLVRDLKLDFLFIDTHPGLNEETLMSIAISDQLFIVLRPDRQDFQGTGVTVEVARKLGVPELYLVLNKVPAAFDPEPLRDQVEEAYDGPVIAVLPHSDEMMQLSSDGVFALEFPGHPLTRELETMAATVIRAQGD